MAKKQNKCRDCSFCTESTVGAVVRAPARIAIAPLRALSWAMKRKCPICGHPIGYHAKDKEGRFKD
jgi:hypothetical protein